MKEGGADPERVGRRGGGGGAATRPGVWLKAKCTALLRDDGEMLCENVLLRQQDSPELVRPYSQVL